MAATPGVKLCLAPSTGSSHVLRDGMVRTVLSPGCMRQASGTAPRASRAYAMSPGAGARHRRNGPRLPGCPRGSLHRIASCGFDQSIALLFHRQVPRETLGQPGLLAHAQGAAQRVPKSGTLFHRQVPRETHGTRGRRGLRYPELELSQTVIHNRPTVVYSGEQEVST